MWVNTGARNFNSRKNRRVSATVPLATLCLPHANKNNCQQTHHPILLPFVLFIFYFILLPFFQSNSAARCRDITVVKAGTVMLHHWLEAWREPWWATREPIPLGGRNTFFMTLGKIERQKRGLSLANEWPSKSRRGQIRERETWQKKTTCLAETHVPIVIAKERNDQRRERGIWAL